MVLKKLSEKTYMCESDSGHVYKISLSGTSLGQIQCSCTGFRHRRKCKHVDFFREQLQGSGKHVRSAPRPKDPYGYRDDYERGITEYLGKRKVGKDA